jgi:voltage-gated potassium channel
MARDAAAYERMEARFARPMVIASTIVLIGMLVRLASAGDSIPFWIGSALADLPWLLFLAQWVVLLRLAPDRQRFLRTHGFLTVVVAMGPVAVGWYLIHGSAGLLALGSALRLGPLGQWLLKRGSLRYLLTLGALIILISTVAFARTEHTSLGEALYWSSTAVTVGPEGPAASHPETMVLTVLLGFLGVGFFAAVVGTLVSVIATREQEQLEAETRSELGGEIEELEERVDVAAEQAEVDNAAIAARLDAMMASLDARLRALEERLPPPER